MDLNGRYESDTTLHNQVMQQLVVLEEVVSNAHEPIRPILLGIHHSVLVLHNILQSIDVRPVLPVAPFGKLSCFDCGTTNMESFHTSKQGGYHLCPSCFQHRFRTGRARTAH